MRRIIAGLIGLGIGMALSPLVVAVPQDVRLIGMAVILGLVGALMMRDVLARRTR